MNNLALPSDRYLLEDNLHHCKSQNHSMSRILIWFFIIIINFDVSNSFQTNFKFSQLNPIWILWCFALTKGSGSHWIAITWCWAYFHEITLQPFNLIFDQHTDLIFFACCCKWTYLINLITFIKLSFNLNKDSS